VLLISGNDRTSKLLADAVRDGYNFDILPKPVHPTVILDFLRGTTEPASNRSRNHPTV
jgi:hypothetical protein